MINQLVRTFRTDFVIIDLDSEGLVSLEDDTDGVFVSRCSDISRAMKFNKFSEASGYAAVKGLRYAVISTRSLDVPWDYDKNRQVK